MEQKCDRTLGEGSRIILIFREIGNFRGDWIDSLAIFDSDSGSTCQSGV